MSTFVQVSGGSGSYDAGKDRFSVEFVGAVEETIGDLLGPRVIDPFFLYIASLTGLRKREIPIRCEEFFAALDGAFGRAGPTLRRSIVKRLYGRLGLQFVDTHNGLLEYVREAKTRLCRT